LASRNVSPRAWFVLVCAVVTVTVCIFRIPSPRSNSGQLHGKLMERKRVTKPGTNIYYELADLQVGGVLEFYRRRSAGRADFVFVLL